MLTRMIRPRRVLELGTFSGYSALSIAEGLDDCAELHTVEAAEELEDFITAHLAEAPEETRGKVHLHFGPALDIIPTLGGDFDMVFIDADKREYPAYYEAVLPIVRPGGYILADNTLWDGHVADPDRHDAQTAKREEIQRHSGRRQTCGEGNRAVARRNDDNPQEAHNRNAPMNV